MNKFSKLALIAATTVMAASVSAQTQTAYPGSAKIGANVVQQPTASGGVTASKQPVNDNWVSGNGDTVWLNGNGERCIRSGFWTPGTANKGCDGALVEVAQPAPPPAPVVEPAPVTREKITYQEEIQFDFDKAVLKADGKAQLDALVEKAKNLESTEAVVVNGYADEIGSPEYNKDLSARRTEPVKAYLVSKGVDENKIYTEGKGQSEPIVTDCQERVPAVKAQAKNKKAKAKAAQTRRADLIKCLAPNRRVKVDFVGLGK